MSAGRMLDNDWFPRPLPANVQFGEGCYVHSSYSFLHYRSQRECGMRIGRHCGIYFETFFDVGPEGYVEVGDYCTLAGPIITTNGRVLIGSYCLISREVIIADHAFTRPPGDECQYVHSDAKRVPGVEITIGHKAWIGTRAMLLAGARLGEGAIVGAGAVVDFEVPPYAIVAGNPARVVGWARPAGMSGQEV